MTTPSRGLAEQSTTPPAVFLRVRTCTLKNGVKVVVYENHRAPVIMFSTCVYVGGADDPYGKMGVAHFAEHLMFRGTKTVSQDAFAWIMDNCGIQYNAVTSHEVTIFMELTPKEHLEQCMKLEADRLAHLNVSPENFEKEKLVVLEELKISASSDTEVLDSRARYNLFPNHPYGRDVIGLPKDVESLSWNDVLDFYAMHYVAKNIVLVIVGDITLEKARCLAEKHYGHLSGPEPQERRWQKRESHQNNEETRIVKSSDQTQQPVLTFYWYAPCFHKEQTLAAALELASKWLGRGKTSYLYRRLVEEQAVASSVFCEAEVCRKEGGALVIQAIPCPNVSVETLEKQLRACLSQCAAENADSSRGATLQDLENVKQKFAAAVPFILDKIDQVAALLAYWLGAGYSPDFIDKYLKLIESVSLDVFRAALRNMGYPPEVVTILLPKEAK
jgi:zinc protease